jgi:hypothetical protein
VCACKRAHKKQRSCNKLENARGINFHTGICGSCSRRSMLRLRPWIPHSPACSCSSLWRAYITTTPFKAAFSASARANLPRLSPAAAAAVFLHHRYLGGLLAYPHGLSALPNGLHHGHSSFRDNHRMLRRMACTNRERRRITWASWINVSVCCMNCKWLLLKSRATQLYTSWHQFGAQLEQYIRYERSCCHSLCVCV